MSRVQSRIVEPGGSLVAGSDRQNRLVFGDSRDRLIFERALEHAL